MKKKNSSLRFQHNQKPNNTKTIPVGKKQCLTIERLSHDGRGITKLQDKTWFVAGALPQEEVEARVISSQSQWVNARCERIITPSSLRQEPPCQYAGVCGGCELQHIPYTEQVRLKQNSVIEQFQRFSAITITNWQPPLVGEPFGYRRRARIAVRFDEKTKTLHIGFRAAFSQQIICTKDCLVLTKSLRQLLEKLPDCLNALNAPLSIGHIELFEGNHTALLIRHVKPLAEIDIEQLQLFCQENQCQLWLQGKANPIPYEKTSSLGYDLSLEKQQLHLTYKMGDFIQVNGLINQQMVIQSLHWLNIKPNEIILDLFCGLGNFTLPIATQAKKVIGIEVSEDMVESAKANAIKNNLNNAEFYQADLSQDFTGKTWANEKFSTIVLDPPREGAMQIVMQINKLNPQRVLYISCNPATLARDAELLIKQGYLITKAGIMDMFPQTSHIETMVLFER